MDYLEIKPEIFHETCDKFRPSHLWKKMVIGGVKNSCQLKDRCLKKSQFSIENYFFYF